MSSGWFWKGPEEKGEIYPEEMVRSAADQIYNWAVCTDMESVKVTDVKNKFPKLYPKLIMRAFTVLEGEDKVTKISADSARVEEYTVHADKYDGADMDETEDLDELEKLYGDDSNLGVADGFATESGNSREGGKNRSKNDKEKEKEKPQKKKAPAETAIGSPLSKKKKNQSKSKDDESGHGKDKENKKSIVQPSPFVNIFAPPISLQPTKEEVVSAPVLPACLANLSENTLERISRCVVEYVEEHGDPDERSADIKTVGIYVISETKCTQEQLDGVLKNLEDETKLMLADDRLYLLM